MPLDAKATLKFHRGICENKINVDAENIIPIHNDVNSFLKAFCTPGNDTQNKRVFSQSTAFPDKNSNLERK